jgi:hypothetical protein
MKQINNRQKIVVRSREVVEKYLMQKEQLDKRRRKGPKLRRRRRS